jgi:hypothetical protein
MTNEKSQNNITIFECLNCKYKTNNKKDFNKHNSTLKHFKNLNINTNINPQCINCDCGKKYKHLSSLIKHKKQCIILSENPQTINNIDNLTNIVVNVVKQNQEFKELIIEQNNKMLELMKEKQLIPSIINNNTNNNHFNLNFFLNEKCKDALNIKDFVSSIQLQLTDLENTGKLGYVDGISKIFINGLKELDVYKRPVHCSDLKRETLYVKDENQWTKESNKLKSAINQISHKNIKQIPEWIKENPACQDVTSKKNDEYLHLINNCMVGSNDEEINDNYKKIIHNISKEVVIEKE